MTDIQTTVKNAKSWIWLKADDERWLEEYSVLFDNQLT